MPVKPMTDVHRPLADLATKPDYEQCMARIEAWFHGAVLGRPPVSFRKHNAQSEVGVPPGPRTSP